MSSLHRPLVELSECLCRTVAEVTGRSLCWCGLYAGSSAPFEYCGSCNNSTCGVGYVALQSASQYSSFGLEGVDVTRVCDSPLQAFVRVGVLRCFPLEEDGSTPPPSVVEASVVDVMADMDAIRQAILCCFPGDAKLQDYNLIGPEGACVGGEWNAFVALET